jgi:hypothetical protein
MAENYLETFRQGVLQLGANGGVNRLAKFQTLQRQAKYPGSNLFYNFSTISIKNNTGIGRESEARTHKDVVTEIDANGNFTQLNYVTRSRDYADTMRIRFANAERGGNYLVPIDTESFLNRRLATKVNG